MGEHSLGAGGSDAGGSNVDCCLGNMDLLDTFLHDSEVVDIVVFISGLQIRKLVLKEGLQLTHNVKQGTCLRRQTWPRVAPWLFHSNTENWGLPRLLRLYGQNPKAN